MLDLGIIIVIIFSIISVIFVVTICLQQQVEQQRTYDRQIDLKEYFPERAYSTFDSQFAQKSCSICLEDFTIESKCRQLYCEHIFHDDCIDLWLPQHHSCPLCKKAMTIQAIEQHFNPIVNEVRPASEYQTENYRPQQDYVYDPINIALESFKYHNGL